MTTPETGSGVQQVPPVSPDLCGFVAGLLGEYLTEADTGGKAGALHLRLRNVEQPADHGQRISFDITQQEQ